MLADAGLPISGSSIDAQIALDSAESLLDDASVDREFNWGLRDKDGVLVDAVVYPGTRASQGDRFGPRTIECVHVEYLADNYIGLDYDLQTGDPVACYPGILVNSWDALSGFVYLDSECKGDEPYSLSGGVDAPVIVVGGKLYSALGQPQSQSVNDIFIKSSFGCNSCKMIVTPNIEITLWSFEPVPNWVVNALSNYPYTLTR
jgi:hypothetical protein